MNIGKIGVVGAGQMGSGIAHVAAAAGHDVVLHDVENEFVQRALGSIGKNMQRAVEKGRLAESDRAQAISRIRATTRLQDLADCDLIVEAVVESLDVKLTIFRELDRLARAGAILASNTSSISITSIASATERPDCVIGMHFMNPVPVMELVEVIRGLATSDETTLVVAELARKLGKTPVECRDFPGFVSNRVLMPLINEAIFCLHEGVGTAEAIDAILKKGANHPMGPLALADLIGLDTCLAILEVLQHGLGDKYRPCVLLRKYVEAGWLGRKSGRGFHDYSSKS